MIRAIAFDLDETLYDEAQFVSGGIRAVAAYVAQRYEVKEFQARWMLQSINQFLGRQAMLDELIQLFDLPSDCLPELIRTYRTHSPKLTLWPGYRELLEELSAHYRLALLTDGLKDVQERKVRSLALERLMDPIIYTWQEGPALGKPCPLSFARLLEKLGMEADEVIYVGDNPAKDFQGARALGMRTVRVRTGSYRLVPPAPGCEPDFTIADLHGLRALIRHRLPPALSAGAA